MRKRIKELRRFPARSTRSNALFTVVEWLEQIESTGLLDTQEQWEEVGRRFRLPDGTPLQPMQDGTFRNPKNGDVLRPS